MITICKTCRHNCNPKGKNKPPIIANNPHAICWCNAESGRVITRKYKKCKFYEPHEISTREKVRKHEF